MLWQSKYYFPTAIGVIDCTHINIPSRHGDQYINHKDKPTLNREATCDGSSWRVRAPYENCNKQWSYGAGRRSSTGLSKIFIFFLYLFPILFMQLVIYLPSTYISFNLIQWSKP